MKRFFLLLICCLLTFGCFACKSSEQEHKRDGSFDPNNYPYTEDAYAAKWYVSTVYGEEVLKTCQYIPTPYLDCVILNGFQNRILLHPKLKGPVVWKEAALVNADETKDGTPIWKTEMDYDGYPLVFYFTFDTNHRIDSIWFEDEDVVRLHLRISYNKNGMITQLRQYSDMQYDAFYHGDITSENSITSEYTYDAVGLQSYSIGDFGYYFEYRDGRRTSETYSTGKESVSTLYEYNEDGTYLKSITVNYATDSKTVYQMVYNPDGTSIKGWVPLFD